MSDVFAIAAISIALGLLIIIPAITVIVRAKHILNAKEREGTADTEFKKI
jgi:hypothetical protein